MKIILRWLAAMVVYSAIIALAVSVCRAQTAILMPMPVIQFSDSSGTPLAGGYVYFYQASTSINQATYTDSTGATVNTDPVVLNAAGEPSSPLGPGFAGGIYLTNGANYRICVFSSSNVQQWCANNVQLFGGSAVGSSSNGQVLYNCAGAVCGSTGLTYNPGTQTLSVTSINVSSGGSLNGTFTGSPTFAAMTVTGEVVAGSLESDAAVNCPGHAVAAAGFIQMCNTDGVFWENGAGSGEEGLTDTTGGVLIVSNAGGEALIGAQPYLYLGGITSSFPVIGSSGTSVVFALGNGGAPPVTQTNIIALDATLQGVTFPSTAGPFTAGQILTVVTPTTATFQTFVNTTVLEQSTTTLATPVSVTSFTVTTWLSKVVTMPTSGCPCRVFGSYDAYETNSSGGVTSAFWLSDGTNQFATSQYAMGNTGSPTGQGASAFSPVTYANSAIVTFNAQVETAGTSETVNSGPDFSGATQFSWLNLVVVSSN